MMEDDFREIGDALIEVLKDIIEADDNVSQVIVQENEDY